MPGQRRSLSTLSCERNAPVTKLKRVPNQVQTMRRPESSLEDSSLRQRDKWCWLKQTRVTFDAYEEVWMSPTLILHQTRTRCVTNGQCVRIPFVSRGTSSAPQVSLSGRSEFRHTRAPPMGQPPCQNRSRYWLTPASVGRTQLRFRHGSAFLSSVQRHQRTFACGSRNSSAMATPVSDFGRFPKHGVANVTQPALVHCARRIRT